MSFTAKDVQALRQSTGAGMMDAKRALEANDGDIEAAKQWLREKGLAASAKRDDRESTQGIVALVVDGNVGAIVKIKSETDFVASLRALQERGPDARRPGRRQGRGRRRRAGQGARGPAASCSRRRSSSAQVVRFEAAAGNVLDSYLHVQGGRGVNGVLVELDGRLAGAGPRHRRPRRLRPAEVPQP